MGTEHTPTLFYTDIGRDIDDPEGWYCRQEASRSVSYPVCVPSTYIT